ncbi:MAG: dihydroorotate dehydrogenase [Oscillospiraceae bacterium]
MVDLSVKLAGMSLENPVIPASGTFGYGLEFAKLYDINMLGSFVMKGTTRDARFGNETPRIAESACGMINAVGLQNPGIRSVIECEMPELRTVFSKKVIANVCGFSLDEYVEVARAFDTQPQVGLLELNISCPNVKHGGMSFGTCPASAAEVTRAVKAKTNKPLFVKLSPNVGDIAEIARACETAGADGISLINTLLAMRIDLKTRKPLLANVTGGLSGRAVFPIALRMVYNVSRAVAIPIIGMGGVACARDVIEMMLAGASAVQIGAENLRDPFACPKIIEELPREAERLGIRKLSEITGEAHR